MSDSRQTWHGTQVHDDDATSLPFADPSSAFASQSPDGGSADRPRRPEDALAEIESLERLIADVSDDRRSASEFDDRPTEPLRVHPVESPRQIEVAPCVVCHGTTATSRFAMTGMPEELVVCDTCGIGSLFPLPNERRVAELTRLAAHQARPSRAGAFCNAAARLRTLWQLRSVPSDGRVLEVTSGDHPSTSLVTGSRFDTFSVRLSSFASEQDNRRIKEHRVRDLADAAFDSRSFEAVVLRGTLERHPHPQLLLDEVRRVLRPGGLLIATLPNFASWQATTCGANWQHLGLPRTLHHFTPDTLRRLLLRSEFESVSIRHSTLSSFLHQLPFGDRAMNCLKRAGHSGPSFLQSLIQRGGTMTVTARLSNLQPVGTILRTDLQSSFAGAFA
jgi:SAM-dependent methyltransferase